MSLTDLYATILDLVDSPLPRPATSHSLLEPPSRTTTVAQLLYPEMWHIQWEGRSRQAALARESFSPSRFALFWRMASRFWSAGTGKWKSTT